MQASLSGCRLGLNAGLVSFPFRRLTTPSFAFDIHPYLAPRRVRPILPIHFLGPIEFTCTHFTTFHRKYLISGMFRIISAHKSKTKT